MRIDPKALVSPIVAAALLLLCLNQTMGALKTAGSWRRTSAAQIRPEDPYANLDRAISRPFLDAPEAGLRDPFYYAAARPVVATGPVRPGPRPTPAPPPRPVLTSIIFDEDPRATIRYNDREFSVRQNTLFADFRVRRISATEVVLERNGEPLLLRLRPKGD